MSQFLQFLWQQIRPNRTRLSMSAVEQWPEGRLDELLQRKLIVETDIPATSVTCDACSLDHSSKVIWLDYPAGRRAFIVCPENGRVQVDLDRLKQWDVDFQLLASHTSESIPGELTRESFKRIQSSEFTVDDQSTILDSLGKFRPAERTPRQKKSDAALLLRIVATLTPKQSAIVNYLWEIPVSVDWDSLPAAGFQKGKPRTDGGVIRALERLDIVLADLSPPTNLKLEILRPDRRVQLIRPRK